MCLHNIITQTQAQPGSLPGRFGGKERLEYFVQYFLRNAITIIGNFYFYFSLNLFVLIETVGSYLTAVGVVTADRVFSFTA